MANTILHAAVAVAITATGFVAAFTSTGNDTQSFGDIPPIIVYADREITPAHGDIPDLIITVDRDGKTAPTAELSHGPKVGSDELAARTHTEVSTF